MPRLRSITLSTAALAAAALLLAPERSTAFTLLGTSLPLSQRDFRVFDNFLDLAANDDPTQHPNFAGFSGAEVALWKGVLEWGSVPHGDGQGDPTQPFDLGSGGSNFDATFQGRAPGPGDLDSNTVSAATLPGGVLVLTELGPGGGWRMRFNEAFLWDDDVAGRLAPGALDLQGVMTREYGFVLGLGSSSVPGAVMSPAVFGNGVSLRDLSPDDSAGVQAIYGAAAPTKPRIDHLDLEGSTLTIFGAGFSPTGNDVWFTREGTGGNGDPVQVQGVTSTAGGTRISVTVPAEAGPGDVLVKGPGSNAAQLSNAWPFDAGDPVCGHAGYGVSLGGANVGRLSAEDPPAVGGNVAFEVTGLTGSGVAYLFFAADDAFLPIAGGTLWIDPTSLLAGFTTPLSSGAGTFSVPIPANAALGGSTIYSQVVAPDPILGWALTGGLKTTLCP